MQFPSVCPEIPVADLAPALAYYRDQLGFNIDWSAEQIGLARLSRGDSRMFMTSTEYRSALGVRGPIVPWINLSNRAEVDALHGQWAAAGARIADPPAAKPYNKLYEFFAQDIDGTISACSTTLPGGKSERRYSGFTMRTRVCGSLPWSGGPRWTISKPWLL